MFFTTEHFDNTFGGDLSAGNDAVAYLDDLVSYFYIYFGRRTFRQHGCDLYGVLDYSKFNTDPKKTAVKIIIDFLQLIGSYVYGVRIEMMKYAIDRIVVQCVSIY